MQARQAFDRDRIPRTDSQGAAPREEIEDPRARERRAENVHPRLAHPVGGGADPGVLGHDQAAAAELPGHDPHQSAAALGTTATILACSVSRP